MIKAIVTDIEGTTSDIRFVHNVLFPYARAHLADYVRQHQAQPAVQDALNAVRTEAGQPDADVDSVIAILFSYMDEDRKSTGLKALQGMIWREGYLSGRFTGHLYPDVLPALTAWHAQGIKLYIYPLARLPRRNCYLATAMKVILLVCLAVTLIPTWAPSAR